MRIYTIIKTYLVQVKNRSHGALDGVKCASMVHTEKAKRGYELEIPSTGLSSSL